MHRRFMSGEKPRPAPASTAVELAQLRIRVIALENLVISSGRQLELVRQMATYISPRPGSPPPSDHPLGGAAGSSG